MINDRQTYYRRRAREERERAAAIEDARVQGIHLEMAIRYELLGGDPPGEPIDDGNHGVVFGTNHRSATEAP